MARNLEKAGEEKILGYAYLVLAFCGLRLVSGLEMALEIFEGKLVEVVVALLGEVVPLYTFVLVAFVGNFAGVRTLHYEVNFELVMS